MVAPTGLTDLGEGDPHRADIGRSDGREVEDVAITGHLLDSAEGRLSDQAGSLMGVGHPLG